MTKVPPTPTHKSAQITTLLFDCDNTLVLSESIAFSACATLVDEILASRNIPTRYTGPELLRDFVGQNFGGMMRSLQQKYGYTMSDSELDAYVAREEDTIIANLRAELQPCVGVDAELQSLYAGGKFAMAVVSSSALRRVRASLETVGQDKFFAPEWVFSAATSLETPTSKPDPAIYLHAMRTMGKVPEECVAVEDSKSGTLSAVRAGIRVVGYVGSYEEGERERMGGILKDAGAQVVMGEWEEFSHCLQVIENAA